MTKIDFYILNEKATLSSDVLACRIIEKAYQQKHSVYLHVPSKEDANRLDELLWTFKQGSFIPHQVIDTNTDTDTLNAPITIGYNDDKLEHYDVLVNMAGSVPGLFSRFTRVAEIVAADEGAKAQARQRFKFYRDRGYPLDTHDLSM